jgi:hypothetical protein
MLKCYICSEFPSNCTKALRAHIRSHEILGDGKFPYVCGQGICVNAFDRLGHYARHIELTHGARKPSLHSPSNNFIATQDYPESGIFGNLNVTFFS